MSSYHTQITIVLDRPELEALIAVAELNLRRPRDQARYILRSALLGAGAGAAPMAELPTNQPEAGRPEPVYSP